MSGNCPDRDLPFCRPNWHRERLGSRITVPGPAPGPALTQHGAAPFELTSSGGDFCLILKTDGAGLKGGFLNRVLPAWFGARGGYEFDVEESRLASDMKISEEHAH